VDDDANPEAPANAELLPPELLKENDDADDDDEAAKAWPTPTTRPNSAQGSTKLVEIFMATPPWFGRLIY
jgi:hypothetical protein